MFSSRMSKLPNNTHTLFHTCGDVVALVKAVTGSVRRLYPQQNKNERKTKGSLYEILIIGISMGCDPVPHSYSEANSSCKGANVYMSTPKTRLSTQACSISKRTHTCSGTRILLFTRSALYTHSYAQCCCLVTGFALSLAAAAALSLAAVAFSLAAVALSQEANEQQKIRTMHTHTRTLIRSSPPRYSHLQISPA
jgi:hypothetical protein